MRQELDPDFRDSLAPFAKVFITRFYRIASVTEAGFCAHFGGERDVWFTDRLSGVATKDAAQEMAGVWLIEVAEMDVLTRASTSTKKTFLTRRRDRFRPPPHAKHVINLPRQCAFAGTINPPLGGYLTDTTGNRWIWPLACRDMIDCDGIERDRDQLWAEAVQRYKAGTTWWLETPELEALATVEQAARFKTDLWTPQIKQWVGRRLDVSVDEVLQGVKLESSHSAEIKVTQVLKTMGFEKYRARKGRKRANRYWRNHP